MSSSGGNMTGISNADYNMYFKMNKYNRGWAFINDTKGGVNAQIEGSGKFHSKEGYRAGSFEMVHNPVEESLDFVYMG
jgi:hypothetical protein